MIKCNEESGTAYILDCYCLTYNEESNSSQAGLCFYNCNNNHQTTMKDTVYHLLPNIPAKDLIGQVYCVVSATKDCILLYSPTISLVWSVQTVTRTGGTLYGRVCSSDYLLHLCYVV